MGEKIPCKPGVVNSASLVENGIMRICGIDEAGRGPLAGPVVAAAVILDKYFPYDILKELRDSKALTDRKRRLLSTEIRAKAYWGIGEASSEEIDAINILQATLLAMQRAVARLQIYPEQVMVDGLFVPTLPCPAKAIVRGDAKIPAIMAASILAKTYRDDLMQKWDKVYPQYGFERHKGYPTKAHREAIRNWGPSPIHRKSFRFAFPL